MPNDDAASSGSWSGLRTRVLSALVIGPVAMAAIWFGGVPFLVMVVLAAVLLCYEWQRIVQPDARGIHIVAMAVVGAIVILAAVGQIRLAATIWLLLALTAALFSRARADIGWVFAGLAYAAGIGLAFVVLRADPQTGRAGTFLICFVVWATDIAAYFAGKIIGGPKLWPRVSPKKTWSGSLGGLAAGMVLGIIGALMMDAGNLLAVAIMAGVLSIAAQLGDLLESAIKRRFDVKDSGTIIPGHGGIMDRVDGLGAAAAVAALIGSFRIGPEFAATGALIW